MLIILTPGFPQNESDSTCLPPQQVFVKALKKNYPTLDILVCSFHYPYQQGSYDWYGIPVIAFGGKNKGGLSRWLLGRRIRQQLEKITTQKKIAGVLSFWCGECALTGKRFAARHRIPHYCWILGQDARAGNNYINSIKPAAPELIALSDFIADEFQRNYGVRPAHIIPPGIDASLFASSPPEKTIDILGAGSLIPLKQFVIWVKVVAALVKEFPQLSVRLVGQGPEKKKLQALIVQSGLEQVIRLTGELSHTDTLQLMQRTKVFLHTSSYEGFGVVCIEALHAGAGVISFCRPMKKEIEDWHIAETTEEMIGMAAILLRKKRQHRGSTVFRIDDTVQSIMNLYGYTAASTP